MIAMNMLSLVMVKAKQDTKKQKAEDRTRDKTPQQVEKKEILVIGSSSTWKREELEHFKVTTEKDVDVTKMIPQKFFVFDHLEEYTQCCSLREVH
jgi:ribonucleotide monophosphatase NagD (HAD superfamily)